MFLNDQPIPVTQTTGMFLRNCIFIDGIPDVMKNAVGTRSERSFEGDTGRFITHLYYGPAYYDDRIVGVYRITENGIWTSLSQARKQLISARFYSDYYQFYGSDAGFFANRAYRSLQAFLDEKKKELSEFRKQNEYIDEYEKLMTNDVYRFCKQFENEIVINKPTVKEKIKQILKIISA